MGETLWSRVAIGKLLGILWNVETAGLYATALYPAINRVCFFCTRTYRTRFICALHSMFALSFVVIFSGNLINGLLKIIEDET